MLTLNLSTISFPKGNMSAVLKGDTWCCLSAKVILFLSLLASARDRSQGSLHVTGGALSLKHRLLSSNSKNAFPSAGLGRLITGNPGYSLSIATGSLEISLPALWSVLRSLRVLFERSSDFMFWAS